MAEIQKKNAEHDFDNPATTRICYDIIHIEDDEQVCKSLARKAKERGLVYACFESLGRLHAVMENNFRSKIYLLDGRFPDTRGGAVIENAGNAARIIKQYHENASIFLYSANENLAEEARKIGAEGYFEKGRISHEELIEELKKRL